MRVNVTEQGLVIPKEFLEGVQSVEIRRENNQIILTLENGDSARHPKGDRVLQEQKISVSKASLGRQLRALRAEIVASGEPLLTAEAIEQEIAEQRERFREIE